MESDDYYTQLCSRLTLQNKALGFFKDLLDRVVPFVNINEFSHCTTDLQRVLYCAQHCWHLVGAELIFRGKNNEDAVAKRLEGNNTFAERNYERALILFSQSVIKAPPGIDLAYTYANRSAVLHKLKEWQLAINDIELAFSYDYPQETRHKLYERMAACHIKLKNYAQAKVVVGLCKHYFKKYEICDEQFQKNLAKHLQNIETAASTSACSIPKGATKIDLIGKFQGASPKLQVKHTVEHGRHSYAEEEISTGELILIEEPYAKALIPDRMGTYCLHCFKKFRVAVACEICANVAFCSKICRQNADKYHRYECRVLSLLIGSGMSVLPHLALRMITQSSGLELAAKTQDLVSKPDEIILDMDGKYNSASYETVYNLSALETQRKPQDFLERTIMTIFLMKCLRLVGYFDINLFKNPNPTEIEIQVGAILLRNLQILQFNAYEITEYIIDGKNNFKNATSFNLGLGLYPTAAFFNHSCSPNVTRYFNGARMCVISTQKIQMGQPICDNYGPLFTKVCQKDRQHKLQGRYWFRCSCEACSADWPAFENMTAEISPKDEKENEFMKKLQKLDNTFYEDGLKAMDKGDAHAASKILSKYLNESDLLINEISSIKPYKTFHLAQEALKLCLPAAAADA